MKAQCATREDAIFVAQLMKQVSKESSAVIEIAFWDVPNFSEWWAIETPEDLREIKGTVQSITRI